ncbi:MAG: hypothetical protein IJW60_03250 [Clostridia bacterium]|nr:hypothetical protein [Clostridia bacterium]
MRKFAFVVFDVDDTVLARTPLDLVTDISGLGWKLKLSAISGDVADVLTKVVQEKSEIKCKVNFLGNGYQKYAALSQWLQKYSTVSARVALEYDDGENKRYVEGKVTAFSKTEIDEYQNLACDLSFCTLSPFFIHKGNLIRMRVSAVGKSYPFVYPYYYGKNVLQNTEIENPYIAEIPLTVKIAGAISTPRVALLDEEKQAYNVVSFPNITLGEGQYIIINSAAKRIWFFDGAKLRDYTAETDPQFDTFLMAKSGLSNISVNLDASGSGELTGSWRQYTL